MFKVPYSRKKLRTGKVIPYIDLVSISQLYRNKITENKVKIDDVNFKKGMRAAFFELYKSAAVDRRTIRLPGLGSFKLREFSVPDAELNKSSGLARVPLNYKEMHRLKKENKPAVVFDLFGKHHYRVFNFKLTFSSVLENRTRYMSKNICRAAIIRKKLYADKQHEIMDISLNVCKNPNYQLKK